MTTLKGILLAFLGGSLVGLGLFLALLAYKGWAVALVKADYCAAGGALGAGMFVSRRLGGPSGMSRLLGLIVGLGVGLWLPAAAWWLAPRLGYSVTQFTAQLPAALGAGCGLLGASLRTRRSKLDDVAENIRRRRLTDRQDFNRR